MKRSSDKTVIKTIGVRDLAKRCNQRYNDIICDVGKGASYSITINHHKVNNQKYSISQLESRVLGAAIPLLYITSFKDAEYISSRTNITRYFKYNISIASIIEGVYLADKYDKPPLHCSPDKDIYKPMTQFNWFTSDMWLPVRDFMHDIIGDTFTSEVKMKLTYNGYEIKGMIDFIISQAIIEVKHKTYLTNTDRLQSMIYGALYILDNNKPGVHVILLNTRLGITEMSYMTERHAINLLNTLLNES